MQYTAVPSGMSQWHRQRYERDASRHWHAFYNRNGARFYKDKSWLLDEKSDGFPCLASAERITVVEAGCGAANAALPILRANPALKLFLFDFAPSAVNLVRSNPEYSAVFNPSGRCTAFLWDFARHDLDSVPEMERCGLKDGANLVDHVLCLFVLSAVPPELHVAALTRMHSLLRPGGTVIFRDYCVTDLAAERFKLSSRIDDNYFVRQDGTLSYFFDEKVLNAAMTSAGFRRVYARRIERTIVNRKEGKVMPRVWLQAVYDVPYLDAEGNVLPQSSE
jgi:methyltransferase-like protein 6